ncbi:DUF6760 family protein [Hydrogenimonas sp.]
MPPLRTGDGGEFRRPKELKSYPLDALYREVAFVAYHFHWSSEEVLQMPHWERKRWCEEISTINRKIGEEERRVSL